MIEGPEFLVSRELPSACEEESKWAYNASRVTEASKGKQSLDEGNSVISLSETEQSDNPNQEESKWAYNASRVTEAAKGKQSLDEGNSVISLSETDQPDNPNQEESKWAYNASHVTEAAKGKQSLDEGNSVISLSETDQPDNPNQEDSKWAYNASRVTEASKGKQSLDEGNSVISLSETEQSSNPNQKHQPDPTTLITPLGRDLSLNCLAHTSRSDYGAIALLNRTFRALIRDGEVYKLRRLMGIVEHWVYFSCDIFEWEAFDPIRRRWMRLPTLDSNECFVFSDKESLAVGTELLVFGREIFKHVVYKYSILTNSWSPGPNTNAPRCLFGSASLNGVGIVAGGCGPSGKYLKSAELYDSETGIWVNLPDMNKPRKLCSGVFMESKFYVIGGIGEGSDTELTSAEVYDMETGKWTEIPDIFPVLTNAGGQNAQTRPTPASAKSPPLLAVVKDELYAGCYETQEVRKYDKGRNVWVRVCGLPERVSSMHGWGLGFRACGDQLVVVGGPQVSCGGVVEVNACVPDENPPQWNLIGRKPSAGFVYNCAVMGC